MRHTNYQAETNVAFTTPVYLKSSRHFQFWTHFVGTSHILFGFTWQLWHCSSFNHHWYLDFNNFNTRLTFVVFRGWISGNLCQRLMKTQKETSTRCEQKQNFIFIKKYQATFCFNITHGNGCNNRFAYKQNTMVTETERRVYFVELWVRI